MTGDESDISAGRYYQTNYRMKDFILLGNKQSATLKSMWPYVMEGAVRYGYTSPKSFLAPDGSEEKNLAGLSRWYTTLPVQKECRLTLTKSYYADPSQYPHYEGFDAIEVGFVKDIPYDYFGVIGVPVTYLDNQHPDFEIVGASTGTGGPLINGILAHQQDLRIKGRTKDSPTRIFIKRRSL